VFKVLRPREEAAAQKNRRLDAAIGWKIEEED
jgi:hypothetical protein